MRRRSRAHYGSLAVIVFFCTAGVLLLSWSGAFLLRKPEYGFQQWVALRGRSAPASEKLVFLGIDAESQSLSTVTAGEKAASPALQLMSLDFPWSRQVYPLILDRLFAAGAKTVILDLMFPTQREGDAAFKAALERYRQHVVIAFNFPDREQGAANASSVQWPTTSLIPAHSADDPRLGYVNVWTDPDEVVRRIWFRRSLLEVINLPSRSGDPVFESLAARGVRQSGFGSVIPNDTAPRHIRYADWGRSIGGRFEPRSIYEIFVPHLWERNYANGAFFRDKIVLVGPWGNWSKDYLPTQFGRMAGPLIHMNAMNALLTGQYISEAPFWADVLLILGGGAIAFLFSYLVLQPMRRAACLVAAVVVWFAIAWLLYNGGWVVPVFAPILALTSSGGGFLFMENLLEQRERQRIRRTLERYVSKDVVKEVLDNPESFLNTMGGVRKPIAILFSDVRGFTTMTEAADAGQLVLQLNEYFTAMVHIVFRQFGTLDKFIGDAVMAHWGGIVTHGQSSDACHAITTALEMLREVRRLNEDWRARGLFELQIGIGINQGFAIVGHIGSEEKYEFSAIGDSVNLASRLEGATKEFHVDILIGEAVAPLVRECFVLRTVDLLQVKGKTAPVEVFTPVSERNGAPEPEWLAHYEEGIQLYRRRSFEQAEAAFAKAASLREDDWLSLEYRRRCGDYERNPPPSEWNGVFVMARK